MCVSQGSVWNSRRDEEVEGLDMCACGCGEPQQFGRNSEAMLLKMGRSTADMLRKKRLAGGRVGRAADELLWAWDRCVGYFDEYVHDDEPSQPPPTPTWLSGWRKRAMEL